MEQHQGGFEGALVAATAVAGADAIGPTAAAISTESSSSNSFLQSLRPCHTPSGRGLSGGLCCCLCRLAPHTQAAYAAVEVTSSGTHWLDVTEQLLQQVLPEAGGQDMLISYPAS